MWNVTGNRPIPSKQSGYSLYSLAFGCRGLLLCCLCLLQVNSTVKLYDSEFVTGRKSEYCWSRCVSNIPSCLDLLVSSWHGCWRSQTAYLENHYKQWGEWWMDWVWLCIDLCWISSGTALWRYTGTWHCCQCWCQPCTLPLRGGISLCLQPVSQCVWMLVFQSLSCLRWWSGNLVIRVYKGLLGPGSSVVLGCAWSSSQLLLLHGSALALPVSLLTTHTHLASFAGQEAHPWVCWNIQFLQECCFYCCCGLVGFCCWLLFGCPWQMVWTGLKLPSPIASISPLIARWVLQTSNIFAVISIIERASSFFTNYLSLRAQTSWYWMFLSFSSAEEKLHQSTNVLSCLTSSSGVSPGWIWVSSSL